MSTETKDVELRIRARDESGKTLAQLTARLEELTNSQGEQLAAAKRGEVGAKALEDSYGRLERVTKALAGQHALTMNFETQARALDQAKQRTEAARAAHEALGRTLSNTEPTAKQARELDRLGRALGVTERALLRAQERLDGTAAKLGRAGIATADLAAEQSRLAAAFKQGNSALERQDDALQKLDGRAARYGQTGVSAFGQVRDAVLALAAAYVGLSQAGRLATGAIAAMSDQQAIESRLSVALETTDPEKIGKEFDYIRGRAEYLGMGIRELAKEYGSFAIAGKSAKLTTDQVRYSFEQLSGGMRVLKMNTEQSGRAWTQITQIMSKAKPEMEDIKTIAESGFAGVQGMMARGLLSVGVAGVRAGTETADMFALMKKGALDSGQAITALAVQAEKELGQRLPQAIQSLVAEQGRLENSVFDFQKLIAESGWADAYQSALRSISEFLKSNDGQAFARNLGEAFAAAAESVVFLLRHFDEVSLALKTFIGLWAGLQLRNGIAQIVEASAALKGMGGAASTATKLFAALQAAIAGWSIGTYLNNESVEVRRFGVALVTGLAEVWAQIKGGAAMAFEDIPRLARNAGAGVVNALTAAMRQLLGLLQKSAAALGRVELADSIGRAMEGLTLKQEEQGARVGEIRKQLARDLAAIRDIGADMWADAERKPPAAKQSSASDAPTPRPDLTTAKASGPTGTTGGDLKNRESLIEGLRRQLEALDASIERSAGQTLSQQLGAVDVQYAKLKRDVDKLGKGDTQGVDMAAELARLVGEKKLAVTRAYNEKLTAESGALQSKLDQADAAAGRKDTLDLEARLGAIVSSYAATYREIEAYRQKLQGLGVSDEPAQLMKERLDGATQELNILERRKFAQEELNRREKLLNDLIGQRDKQAEGIKAKRAAGQLNEAQAVQQLNDLQAQAVPTIQAAGIAATQWATANATLFPSPEAQAAFIATIDAVTAKAVTGAQAFTQLEGAVVNSFSGAALTAIDAIAKSLAGLVNGTMTWGDALRSATGAVGNMFAEVLRGIAQAIIKQQVLNAVLAISKALGWGGVANAAIAAGAQAVPVNHDGGVVGRQATRSRAVDMAMFAGAQRLHSGGMPSGAGRIPGLQPDEVPTILQKSEEVLTRDDPRHILNGGKNGGGGGSSNRFVLVDDRSKVAEAMASSEGENVTMVHLKRNISTIKQWIK